MAKKFDNIFTKEIKEEKTKKIKQAKYLNSNIYELACESFNRLYFNYTNEYYERNLGIYLCENANLTSKYYKIYKKVRNKLERIKAVNEGKDILEFLRNAKRLIKEFIYFIIRFFKAFLSSFKLLYKIVKYILTKPFKKDN